MLVTPGCGPGWTFTLELSKESTRPYAKDAACRPTVPENPFALLTTIVEPEEVPLRICHPPDKPELESTEKFGAVPGTTLYLIVRVWVKVPSVAVTFTL